MSDDPWDPDAERLLRLSQEVTRIAGLLAQLSMGLRGPPGQHYPASNSNEPGVCAETVGWLIRARRQRARYLSPDLFAEPAWDMLLDLLHAELEARPVSVSRCASPAAFRQAPASDGSTPSNNRDWQAMMNAALLHVRELAGPQVTYPKNAQDLLNTLEPIYTGFDSIAPIATMLRSTPQGRQMRLAQNKGRVASYERALADAVNALPGQDRKLATAMLQVLHTTPWLEMRDHWGLDGKQIARATGWAVRTLLKDLEKRGKIPLDEDIPE